MSKFSAGKTVVLVAVPGAFTPAGSIDHVSDVLADIQNFVDKGVDAVVILATSDFFAVKAGAYQPTPADNIHFMADGSQRFIEVANQLLDLGNLGFGTRNQRHVAILRDRKIETVLCRARCGQSHYHCGEFCAGKSLILNKSS